MCSNSVVWKNHFMNGTFSKKHQYTIDIDVLTQNFNYFFYAWITGLLMNVSIESHVQKCAKL
jgi:hypothetical protein